MNEQRQQAYLELVQALLQCESGQEAVLLQAHPDLVDEGLVAALLAIAKMMEQDEDPSAAGTIEWLQNFAAQLAQNLGLVDHPNRPRIVILSYHLRHCQ